MIQERTKLTGVDVHLMDDDAQRRCRSRRLRASEGPDTSEHPIEDTKAMEKIQGLHDEVTRQITHAYISKLEERPHSLGLLPPDDDDDEK